VGRGDTTKEKIAKSTLRKTTIRKAKVYRFIGESIVEFYKKSIFLVPLEACMIVTVITDSLCGLTVLRHFHVTETRGTTTGGQPLIVEREVTVKHFES